jgi:preprotein translocase subunit SecA
MRLFGSERIAGIMSRLGMEEGEALEHRWLNRSVETAQRRVEQQNFSIRKRTLEYDDVMNKQREVIYAFRGDLVRAEPEEVRARLLDVINDLIVSQCETLMANPKETRTDELIEWIMLNFPVVVHAEELQPLAGQYEAAGELIFKRVDEAYAVKCSFEDPLVLPIMERQVVLHAIDTQWQEYLRAMDELKGEIAQTVFRASTSVENIQRLKNRVAQSRQRFIHDEVSVLGQRPAQAGSGSVSLQEAAAHPAISDADFDRAVASMIPPKLTEPVRRDVPKVGRNDNCPCGSGKKYKKCCGQ